MTPISFFIAKSQIDGNGVFARSLIKRGEFIGPLTGNLIPLMLGRSLVLKSKRIHLWEFDCNPPSSLIITNALKYINHSCRPNVRFKEKGYSILVYALRRIDPGDELTADYGPDTHHGGKLKCKCPYCKGKGRL